MKKFYIIHIITFIMSIFIRMDWISKFSIIDISINALLDITLINTLIPGKAMLFNGLSWFLSVTFLLYIIALPLVIFIKKIGIILKYK